MKTFTIGFLSLILAAFRFLLVLSLLKSGTASAIILGLIGLVAVMTTATAWILGKPDWSWTGLMVGLGHLVVLMLSPGELHLEFFAPFFWLLVAVQCWAKWHLGKRCTVTGPVWVNLVESGPYSIVRHPMTFVELLIAQTFVCEWPSWWNCSVLLLVIASKIAITLWEEKFLIQQDSYREYCKRVPWRFIPWVW